MQTQFRFALLTREFSWLSSAAISFLRFAEVTVLKYNDMTPADDKNLLLKTEAYNLFFL